MRGRLAKSGHGMRLAVYLAVLVPVAASAQPDATAQQRRPPGDVAPPQPAPAQPTIVSPVALSDLSVPYPEGAQGEASVVVELVVGVEGRITAAQSISGPEPFASAAVAAADGFRFSPALRDGQAMAARIRVRVDFVPPVVEELTPLPAEPIAVGDPETPPPPPPVVVSVHGRLPVGVKKLGRGEVRQMPGAFGDPFRAIESLPGVTPIASGLPYFFIRGAPPGNVGYFFDRVSVPLLYHVAAGPGVIHPAFIKSVDLYAGAYPARYGRFSGGIVAGEAEDPRWETRGEASIRLVDAGAFLEFPFADGRGSAMLAGRYSYTGAIVSLLAEGVTLRYWDYQGRIRYDLTPEDSLTLFGFGSHDFLSEDDGTGRRLDALDLTFHRLNLAYEKKLGSASTLNLALLLGMDRTGLAESRGNAEEDSDDLNARSVGARLTYDSTLSEAVSLSVGADVNVSRFDVDVTIDDGPAGNERGGDLNLTEVTYPAPGFPEITVAPLEQLEDERAQAVLDSRFTSRDDRIAGAWVEAELRLGGGVTLMPGLRLDSYEAGSGLTWALEPRLGVRFQLSPSVTLTHALGIAHQPPSFAIPIPGLSGAADEGLQRAIHSSAGVEAQLPAQLRASATLFQNVTFDSTDVFGAASLQDSDPNVTAFTARTTNHSYGLELYLRRPLTARLGGFLSYTLSQSARSTGRLEGPSSFDRRHVITAALASDLGRRWRLGGRVMAYSGNPAEVAYAAAAQDPPRAPWFYRLDLRLEKRWLIGSEGAWWAVVLEVLNSTLNEETVQSSCYAYGCRDEAIGPVTIPSIGVEASF